MRPARIIGEKKPRTRVLTDAELKGLWITSEQLGYPYGPLVRLLMLTGQRKSEVAEAQWSEFDLAKREWSIPPERMKMDAAHLVPLTDDAVKVRASVAVSICSRLHTASCPLTDSARPRLGSTNS
jgi:integrase